MEDLNILALDREDFGIVVGEHPVLLASLTIPSTTNGQQHIKQRRMMYGNRPIDDRFFGTRLFQGYW